MTPPAKRHLRNWRREIPLLSALHHIHLNYNPEGMRPTRRESITASDPNGFADLNRIYFLVNTHTSIPAGRYHGYYDRASNALFLYNDAFTGLAGPITPGTAAAIQCAINGGASSVTAAGNSLPLNLNLTRQGNYTTGARNLYIWTTDSANTCTGWLQAATWQL